MKEARDGGVFICLMGQIKQEENTPWSGSGSLIKDGDDRHVGLWYRI